MKQRVFSGTRATGRLHIGNYLGAIKGYIDLQHREDLDCLYMVVDLHTITTPFNRQTLAPLTYEVVLDYLGAGLDPNRAVIALQSHVPQHPYLSWLFASQVSVARLQHLPTFKEKVKLHPENVNLALLSYPVLMAADILNYEAQLVPVGLDQEPHIELAREIARKMNQTYGLDLPEPQRFATPVSVVPSLTGEGKMSKSVEGSTIFLTDTLESIQKKLAGVPTNSGKGKIVKETHRSGELSKYLDENGHDSPGVASLLAFVEYFQGANRRNEYDEAYEQSGLRFGDLKKELATAIYDQLEPIQAKRLEYVNQPKVVEEILHTGAQKARLMAQQTVDKVTAAMGFWA